MSATSGVPVFTGNGLEFAASVKSSVFYGESRWTLTLPELLARCEFSTVRLAGFFVVDGFRRSISHHVYGTGDALAEMLDFIGTHYAAVPTNKERMRFTAQSVNETSSVWDVFGNAGDKISPEIVSANPLAMTVLNRAVLPSFDATLPKLTFQSVLSAVEAAMPTVVPLTHWVMLASQTAGEALLWCMDAETAAVPDWTARTIGVPVLDEHWTFTVRLSDVA